VVGTLQYWFRVVTNFAECFIRPAFNATLNTLRDISAWVKSVADWMEALVIDFWNWFTVDLLQWIVYDFIPWIETRFRQWMESNPSLAVMLKVWDTIQAALVDALGELQNLVQDAITLLGEFRTAWDAIVNSWSVAPAKTLPGAPDCETDASHTLCISVYIFDNTIFKPETPGELTLYLLMAWVSAHMVIHTISRVGMTIREVSAS
jgi:hypothetical protein